MATETFPRNYRVVRPQSYLTEAHKQSTPASFGQPTMYPAVNPSADDRILAAFARGNKGLVQG